jgi:hypothetical protein
MAGNPIFIGENNFTIGALYDPPPGFSQPGGVGTTVYPQQVTGGGPISLTPVTEMSGYFSFGCGHVTNSPMIFRDFDLATGMSAALICCSLCHYLQRVVEPYEEIYDPIANAVIVP